MLRRFLRFYIPYKKVLILTPLGAVITSLIELFFPLYMRHIMHHILPHRAHASSIIKLCAMAAPSVLSSSRTCAGRSFAMCSP